MYCIKGRPDIPGGLFYADGDFRIPGGLFHEDKDFRTYCP